MAARIYENGGHPRRFGRDTAGGGAGSSDMTMAEGRRLVDGVEGLDLDGDFEVAGADGGGGSYVLYGAVEGLARAKEVTA